MALRGLGWSGRAEPKATSVNLPGIDSAGTARANRGRTTAQHPTCPTNRRQGFRARGSAHARANDGQTAAHFARANPVKKATANAKPAEETVGTRGVECQKAARSETGAVESNEPTFVKTKAAVGDQSDQLATGYPATEPTKRRPTAANLDDAYHR